MSVSYSSLHYVLISSASLSTCTTTVSLVSIYFQMQWLYLKQYFTKYSSDYQTRHSIHSFSLYHMSWKQPPEKLLCSKDQMTGITYPLVSDLVLISIYNMLMLSLNLLLLKSSRKIIDWPLSCSLCVCTVLCSVLNCIVITCIVCEACRTPSKTSCDNSRGLSCRQ